MLTYKAHKGLNTNQMFTFVYVNDYEVFSKMMEVIMMDAL